MVSLTEFRGKIAFLGSLLVLFTTGPISQQEDEFLMFGIAYIICVVVMFIVWIILAIWVYRDAKERGMSAALWLIIVLLFGILGLIIYLVVRHDKPAYPAYQQPYQQPYPQQYQQPPPGYQQPYDQQQQPPEQQPQQYDPETGQYK